MLKGTLDEFAITDVFGLLGSPGRTGRLDLERPAGSGHVLFRDGNIVYAQTSLTFSLLGQKLVATGALSETQLRTALDERAESESRLGEIVVAAGLVKQEQLDAALAEQIEDAVFEVLEWDTGEFSWEPAPSVESDVEIDYGVDEAITALAKRLEEMEMLKRSIPSPRSIPVMALRPPDGAEAITMTSEEWQTLVLISGSRNVAEIGQVMGRSEIDMMRTLYPLVSRGLIEMRTEEGDPIEAPVSEVSSEVEEAEPAQTTAVDGGEDWFSDPGDAVDPMSTGEAASVDLDEVDVSVGAILNAAGDDEAMTPSSAFPSSGVSAADKAAAARELAGIMADEPKPVRASEGPEDDKGREGDQGKGFFSRRRNNNR
jgi:hypothetical protein